MDAAQFLPTEPSPEVTQIHEGDYKDADGLWHCGVCGKARQKKINSPYFHKTVWCICDCRVKELEEQRRKEEYEEEMHRVQRLKDASMMASKFRDAEFSVYQKRTENQRAYDVSRKYAAQFRQMITEGNPKTGEKNLGLVFYGPCGTGKSFTAACIANELMEQNISVVMTSFVKILQDIQGHGYHRLSSYGPLGMGWRFSAGDGSHRLCVLSRSSHSWRSSRSGHGPRCMQP